MLQITVSIEFKYAHRFRNDHMLRVDFTFSDYDLMSFEFTFDFGLIADIP